MYIISPRDATTFCKQCRTNEALFILHVIGKLVRFSTYDFLLQVYLNNKTLTKGKLVHAHMIQMGFQWKDIVLGNKLVSLYAKCGSLVDGYVVLNQLPMQDVAFMNDDDRYLCQAWYSEEALRLFK